MESGIPRCRDNPWLESDWKPKFFIYHGRGHSSLISCKNLITWLHWLAMLLALGGVGGWCMVENKNDKNALPRPLGMGAVQCMPRRNCIMSQKWRVPDQDCQTKDLKSFRPTLPKKSCVYYNAWALQFCRTPILFERQCDWSPRNSLVDLPTALGLVLAYKPSSATLGLRFHRGGT